MISSPLKKAEPVIKNKSYIQNYSCITPFGLDVPSLWKACVDNQPRFEQGLSWIPKEITQACMEKMASKIRPPVFQGADRNELLMWTLLAIDQCLNGDWQRIENQKVGVVVSTTTGLTPVWEGELMNHFRQQETEGHLYYPVGSFAVELKNQIQSKGPIHLVSSACCAGTQAVGMAQSWIESGYVDECFVVGAEQICQLTERGFRSLSLVNGEDCRPFNENFNNICLSESVAVLLMTKDSKNAKAQITGFGCSSDAYSMTAPKPDGSGPVASMKMALQKAGLHSQDVDWVHAHGTGSLQNDRAEATAINQLELDCPVSSTKGVHGHTLAAAGVLEALLCVEALQKQEILPTHGADATPFEIQLTSTLQKTPLKNILKNTLGFGGVNSSLVISEVSP